MRVKRYIVDSMPDALQKIRTDLGKDAVILNTKEVKTGGFMGMFTKKKIEVIAAIDAAEPAEPSKPAYTLNSAAVSYKPANKAAASYAAAAGNHNAPSKRAESAVAVLEAAERLAFPEVKDVLPPQETPATFETAIREAANETATTSVSAASATLKAMDQHLLEEIRQMKEMMVKLSLNRGDASKLPEPYQYLESRLLAQEIEPQVVNELIMEVMQDEDGSPLTEEAAFEAVREQLNQILRIDQSKTISPTTRVAHFVGPTGVGKTTTIAKLAAEQVLKHRRKVGFITSDTYRIAAVEQLKTYATILNVPLEVVFSPQDLPRAFEQLQGCELIFMDTAGRNFRNELFVSELNALLGHQGKSETFLVLSLTMKYKDMKAITSNFTKFKLDKVLFTKMDETDTYGSIINLLHEFPLALSYVAFGQSVPDDITEINEKEIIDLILGDPIHE